MTASFGKPASSLPASLLPLVLPERHRQRVRQPDRVRKEWWYAYQSAPMTFSVLFLHRSDGSPPGGITSARRRLPTCRSPRSTRECITLNPGCHPRPAAFWRPSVRAMDQTATIFVHPGAGSQESRCTLNITGRSEAAHSLHLRRTNRLRDLRRSTKMIPETWSEVYGFIGAASPAAKTSNVGRGQPLGAIKGRIYGLPARSHPAVCTSAGFARCGGFASHLASSRAMSGSRKVGAYRTS